MISQNSPLHKLPNRIDVNIFAAHIFFIAVNIITFLFSPSDSQPFQNSRLNYIVSHLYVTACPTFVELKFPF